MTGREENFVQKDRHSSRAAEGMAKNEEARENTFGRYCDNWIAANRTRLKVSSRARYKAEDRKSVV